MDEAELLRRYKETGDIAARNAFLEPYLYIAAILAKKFVGRGVEYDDLYGVASLALVKGVDRYDPSKGKFSTFITPTITGEIKNYFRDRSRMVHLPRRISELRTSVRRAQDELTLILGRKPSAAEIAETLGVSEEEVLRAAEAGGVVSLDRPVNDEEGGSFYDLIPAENDPIETFEMRDAVRRAIGDLNERERTLVGFRFGQSLSQTETAKRMGVSQMYVSRLERKILEKLKENLKGGLA